MHCRVEIVRGIRHFRQGRHTIAQQSRDTRRIRSGRNVEPCSHEKRAQCRAELGFGQVFDVLVIHPFELVRIEASGRRRQPLQIEPGDELFAGEHFGIAMRPAQAREIVEDCAGQVAVVAVLHDAPRTMPLGEFLAFRRQDRRQVRIDRHCSIECADHVDLPRRIVDVIVAADHVGDAHVEIVDDDAEIVSGGAVRAGDDQIVELLVCNLDATFHGVVPGDDAVDRIAEADHGRNIGGWLR